MDPTKKKKKTTHVLVKQLNILKVLEITALLSCRVIVTINYEYIIETDRLEAKHRC